MSTSEFNDLNNLYFKVKRRMPKIDTGLRPKFNVSIRFSSSSNQYSYQG